MHSGASCDQKERPEKAGRNAQLSDSPHASPTPAQSHAPLQQHHASPSQHQLDQGRATPGHFCVQKYDSCQPPPQPASQPASQPQQQQAEVVELLSSDDDEKEEARIPKQSGGQLGVGRQQEQGQQQQQKLLVCPVCAAEMKISPGVSVAEAALEMSRHVDACLS